MSKQSTRAKLITAVSRGRRPFSITPPMFNFMNRGARVTPSMVTASGKEVRPMGKAMTVVTRMPMIMAPLTL